MPTPAIEKRQEWYQVLYNLGAQRGHLALTEGDRDRELLQRAVQDVALLVNRAAATLLDFGVLSPDQLDPRVPTNAQDRALAAFLQDTAEPSAVVLLAGLLRELHGDWRQGHPEPLDRQRLFAVTGRLEVHAPESLRDTASPSELVEYVLQWQNASYRVRYNLACYFVDADDPTAEAYQQLSAALVAAPTPQEATALAQWALADPSLAPLRMRDPRGFQAMVGPWLRTKLPDRVHVREAGSEGEEQRPAHA